ncbi:hypothetical protein HK097_010441 [Rhizophlyctis rosea]|uniref:Nuclear pore complex protein n=1 Tax=Rhizophlyctis rosea TaxID=64517 RepID=A0AAD5S934_9FUNG|nr:hypothetical protein HK097_010441 [Rhizophlyctis rosea]
MFTRFRAEPVQQANTLFSPEDLDDLGEEVDEFADIYNRWSQLDGEDLLEDTGPLCSFEVVTSSRAYGDIDTNLDDPWKLESDTWDLMKRLLQVRIDIQPDQMETDTTTDHFRSDMAIMDRTFATDPQFQETYRTIRSGVLGTRGNSNVVDALDPDAPVRQRKGLAPEDQSHENDVYRTIFGYYRRGRGADATDLCVKCDQSWRAASLTGGLLWSDNLMDGAGDSAVAGNQNRDLWKAVCYRIASDPDVHQTERAIYAVQCGDVQNVLPFCTTWEDFVWAHYNALLDSETDKYLKSYARETMSSADVIELDLPPPARQPHEIFESAEKGGNVGLSKASLNPFRIIQKYIILNRMNECFEYFAGLIKAGRAHEIPQLPAVLRMLTHYAIMLRPLGFARNDESTNILIKSYAELLAEAGKKNLVAPYTRVLPNQLQVEVYARFLERNEDGKEERRGLISLAQVNGLNVREIVVRTVENVFGNELLRNPLARGTSEIRLSSLGDPIDAVDLRHIRALEWVTFDKTYFKSALVLCNKLVRRFLAGGRIQSAQELLKRMPADLVPEEGAFDALGLHMDERRTVVAAAATEYSQYLELLRLIEEQEEWSRRFYVRPGGNNQAQLHEWTTNMQAHTRRTVATFESLLDGDWMQMRDLEVDGEDEDEQRFRELQHLRDLYIPEIFLWLTQILYETRGMVPGNIQKTIKLADMVADPKFDYWKEFKASGKLDVFLREVRRAMIEVVDEPKDWPWATAP